MTVRPWLIPGALVVLGTCWALKAQATPPEKPWLPFPELPAVLCFDDFEGTSVMASDGKLTEAPDDKTTKSYLMSEARFTNLTKVGSKALLELSANRVKVPNGLKPAQLLLEFKVWAEGEGNLQYKVTTQKGTESMRGENLPAAKWTPVSICLSKVPKLDPADTIVRIQLLFIPSKVDTFQKVYMDDVMVLNGVRKAADVMPLLQAVIKRRKDMERNPDKDGFVFRSGRLEDVKQAIQAEARRKKSRTVLLFPPRPEDSQALVQALQKAAPAARLSGYTFVPAEAPDGSPAGGLEDTRTLLHCNLNKTQTVYAVIMLSYHDVQGAGCSPELVDVAVERALGAGCVPVIVVPPLVPSANRAKLETFVKAVTDMGAAKSIVVVEASSLLKNAGDPLVKGELGPQGLEATAPVILNGIKCIETYLFNHR